MRPVRGDRESVLDQFGAAAGIDREDTEGVRNAAAVGTTAVVTDRKCAGPSTTTRRTRPRSGASLA
jgi:hypothetical protein